MSSGLFSNATLSVFYCGHTREGQYFEERLLLQEKGFLCSVQESVCLLKGLLEDRKIAKSCCLHISSPAVAGRETVFAPFVQTAFVVDINLLLQQQQH